MKHVKENDLAHGEFGKWLDSIEMNTSQASRFIRVYTELNDSKLRSNANIGFANLIEIATLPPEQREQAHTLASGETKTVDEMTVRELREVKAELKKATDKAAQAETARQLAEHKAQNEKKRKAAFSLRLFLLNQVRKDISRYYLSKSRHLAQFHMTLSYPGTL